MSEQTQALCGSCSHVVVCKQVPPDKMPCEHYCYRTPVPVPAEKMDIESLSAAVHKAYCDNYLARNGKPYWTGGDYSKFYEKTKGIDRQTVRAVLDALAEEQGWISVNDRLPPEDEFVLVYPEMSPWRWIRTATSRRTWYNAYDNVVYDGKHTHWMPLPPPPEADK